MAGLSMLLMVLQGGLAGAGLVLLRRRGSIPAWIVSTVLVLSLLTTVVVGLAANAGSRIRHTEIREESS